VERGLILGQAANHARDMANEPANLFTPSVMAERAQALAEDAGLECQVLEREEMEKLGMGALLGVAVGSAQPPKFIILRYRSNTDTQEAIGLLGKGITFDAGGISIKPSRGMEEMKGDMSGGAAVISAMWALAKLKVPVNVTAAVPATENMPSGSATKPGDVVRAMNGKTIEVINTDAEGRLILADAICYARQEKLSPIIDVATLTGAMQIALGPAATGFMATDDALAEAVTKAGEACGERMWRFPLIDEYRESLKSTVADIKNTGSRYGAAISAAKFLHFFAEDTPWAHMDMGATGNVDKDKGPWVKGATGIPTRTLVNLVLSLSSQGK
jgi:leucyl aminopeptidase